MARTEATSRRAQDALSEQDQGTDTQGITAPLASETEPSSARAITPTQDRASLLRRIELMHRQLDRGQNRVAVLEAETRRLDQEAQLAHGRVSALQAGLAVERQRAAQLADRLAEESTALTEQRRSSAALEAALRRKVARAEADREAARELADTNERRLRTELRDERERSQLAREQLTLARHQLDERTQQLASLTAGRDVADRRIAELEHGLEGRRQASLAITSERDAAHARSNDAVLRAAQLTSERDDAGKRIVELEGEVAREHAEREAAVAGRGATRVRLEQTSTALNRVRRELQTSLADRDSARVRLGQAQVVVASRDVELRTAAAHSQALGSQLRDAQAQCALGRDALARTRDALRIASSQRSRARIAFAIAAVASASLAVTRSVIERRTPASAVPAAVVVDATAADRIATRSKRSPQPLPPVDVRDYSAVEQQFVRRRETADYRLTATLRTAEEVEVWLAYVAQQPHESDGTASASAAARTDQRRRQFDHTRTTYVQVVVEDLGLQTSFDINTIAAAFTLSTANRSDVRGVISRWQAPIVVPASLDGGAVMRLRLEFPVGTSLPTMLTFRPSGSEVVELSWE